MGEEAKLDKFYTLPHVVDNCLRIVENVYKDWERWNLIVEPSAGCGNFFLKIPSEKKIGIDILPEDERIIKQDFFTFKPFLPSSGESNKILVIGNPPFGRVSSLAIKFFNHASEWASVIAFIVPRTFRRISVQNKLNLSLHLIYDEDIPTEPCSFYPRMMAKCCFQIWERREEKRETVQLKMSHADWEFLSLGPKDDKGQPTPPDGADFALRAYGGKCGEIKETCLETLRPKSWHWIKMSKTSKINKEVLIERFKSLDYSLSLDTARQNSIGKGELVNLYSESFDE